MGSGAAASEERVGDFARIAWLERRLLLPVVVRRLSGDEPRGAELEEVDSRRIAARVLGDSGDVASEVMNRLVSGDRLRFA